MQKQLAIRFWQQAELIPDKVNFFRTRLRIKDDFE